MLDAALCMKITDASSKCITIINITRLVDTKMTSLSFFKRAKMKLQEGKSSHSKNKLSVEIGQ